MAFEDWEKDETGNVKVVPFAGLDTFVPQPMLCGVRIAFATNPDMLASAERLHLPLIMSPEQARIVAGALNAVADTAERAASPDEKLN